MLSSTAACYLSDMCDIGSVSHILSINQVKDSYGKAFKTHFATLLVDYKASQKNRNPDPALSEQEYEKMSKDFDHKKGSLESVLVVNMVFYIDLYIQHCQRASESLLSNPTGIDTDGFLDGGTVAWALATERKLDGHKRIMSTMFPEVDVLSNKSVRERLASWNKEIDLFKKHYKMFHSTIIPEFNQLCRFFIKDATENVSSKINLFRIGALVDWSHLSTSTNVHFGLPVCIELGLTLAQAVPPEQLPTFKAKVVDFQKSFIRTLANKSQPFSKERFKLLADKLTALYTPSKYCLAVEAFGMWINSWICLALLGIFQDYLPTPDPHPLHFSPVQHLAFYCESSQRFLKASLKPTIEFCFETKRLREELVFLLKGLFEVNVAMGRIITNVEAYKQIGAEYTKKINEPVKSLALAYVDTMQSLVKSNTE
jgi:hypothetical protein